MPRFRQYLWFITLLVALAFGLGRSLSMPPSDFAGYYYGSRALIHGLPGQAYDITRLNDLIAADGYRNVFVSYTPFPPFTSLVFAPFLVFPMNIAKLIFNCVSIAVFLFSLMRVCLRQAIPRYLIVLLPVVFFIPLLNNLAFGQAYLLLFALLAEGWLAYKKERRLLAAALWAAAILFKLFPAFLFLFLPLKKNYRQTAWLAIACVLLLVPSVILNGIPAWKFYVSVIVPRMGHGELNDSYTYIFQSAFMLLKRAFRYDALLNPLPLTDSPWLFTVGMALFKAAVLSAAVRVTLRERDDFFAFTVWVAASLLISPNGSSYSLILLIFPLLGLSWRIGADTRGRMVLTTLASAVLLLTAACAVPVAEFGRFALWLQFPRLYLLIVFFCLLVCRLRPVLNAGLFAGLTVAFIAVDIRGNLPAEDPSQYVLTTEAHLFICDYYIRGQRLAYTWRDDRGLHEQQTDLPIGSMTAEGLEIRDNQVWYRGRQMTDSPDQKVHPALVDGSQIYYLSDAHRGFGFYTLRRIKPAALSPAAAGAPATFR